QSGQYTAVEICSLLSLYYFAALAVVSEAKKPITSPRYNLLGLGCTCGDDADHSYASLMAGRELQWCRSPPNTTIEAEGVGSSIGYHFGCRPCGGRRDHAGKLRFSACGIVS